VQESRVISLPLQLFCSRRETSLINGAVPPLCFPFSRRPRLLVFSPVSASPKILQRRFPFSLILFPFFPVAFSLFPRTSLLFFLRSTNAFLRARHFSPSSPLFGLLFLGEGEECSSLSPVRRFPHEVPWSQPLFHRSVCLPNPLREKTFFGW